MLLLVEVLEDVLELMKYSAKLLESRLMFGTRPFVCALLDVVVTPMRIRQLLHRLAYSSGRLRVLLEEIVEPAPVQM